MTARVKVAGFGLSRLTERQVVGHLIDALRDGQGGWVATPNVDICRAARRDPAVRELIGQASLTVADGMPLLWAARLRGTPLPERVTGASLIFSISAAAARHGQSVYLLGGEPGVPERAAEQLVRRYPGLRVAGTSAPPIGFDATERGVAQLRDRLTEARPDVVFVGLGCPKQERLITRLAPVLPTAWFIACGAAIPFAAGTLQRAPDWMQRAGLEWAYRLANEPRRLVRRYLLDDLPFAASLLASSAAYRLWAGAQSRSPHETGRP